MNRLSISLFNATGLPKQVIYPILNVATDSSLLFLTETWLLAPTKYPTSWKQFHTYGSPINSSYNKNRGHLGISLLVNPLFKSHIYHIHHENPLLAKYTLSVVISSKVLIHCLYIPPNLGDNELSEILEQLPLNFNNTTSTIICGDFNARMGEVTGDIQYNPKGRRILNWVLSNGLVNWNQRLAFGHPTSYSYQGNSIVDYFFSNTDFYSPNLCIRDDLSLDSTHKMLTLDIQLPVTTPSEQPSRPPSRKLWYIKKLKQETIYNQYQIAFKNNLNLILPPPSTISFQQREDANNYIENINSQLCEAIYSALDRVCGRQNTKTDSFLKDFWTEEMTETFELKEYYYRKWRKASGLNCLKYWLLHQQTKAKLRRLTVQRRNETWRQFCEKMAKSEYTKAITKFSRIRKNRSLKPIFSVAEGPQHAANIMANHLQQTFSGSLSPENGATSFNLTSQSSQPFSPDSYPFSIDSIKSAIELLPRNKAPGIDHIKSEMIQPLIGILSPIFFYMFQLC